MIYGNTGAGLVDIDIPQNPLFQQALPDLKQVSASAWGLPALDDIAVPDVTIEKDIQTDADLTDKYFALAQKLKDYAIKGRSVGIDVTKPQNNPTHLQYSQEWNKMYGEFMQTGKELKNAKQNQQLFEKAKSNPNAIVGNPNMNEVFSSDVLSKNVIEDPFAKVKGLQKAYSKPIAIYDQNQYQSFLQRWQDDYDFVDNQIEDLKLRYPEMAEKIESDGEQVRESLIPPMYDSKFAAKLAQDMQKHRENLGVKKYNAETSRGGLELRQSQQQVAEGQFRQGLNQLINTPDTEIEGMFGAFEFDSDAGKDKFVPHTVITTSASNLKSYGVKNLLQPNGNVVDVDKLDANKKYIVVNDGTKQKVYPVTDKGIAAFTAKYQQPYKRLEEQAKQQIGSYDLTQEDDIFEVVGNQPDVKVSTKTTQASSSKATSSTTKKTNTAKTYSIINPKTGKVEASGVSKEDADKAIAKGYKVK